MKREAVDSPPRFHLLTITGYIWVENPAFFFFHRIFGMISYDCDPAGSDVCFDRKHQR